MKLWGGRFQGGPAEALARLSVSVHFDWRLARYDIAASKAHARVLASAGLLGPAELGEMLAALDAFVAETQKHVSGEIRMTLHGGRAVVTGRRSEESLYNFDLATYDEGDKFDQSLARGFVELWGLPSRLAAHRDNK